MKVTKKMNKGKRKHSKEKSFRRERPVKIVNEPIFDDSETDSAQFDDYTNDKRTKHDITFDENIYIEEETVQSEIITYDGLEENNIRKDKIYTNRQLRVRIKNIKWMKMILII